MKIYLLRDWSTVGRIGAYSSLEAAKAKAEKVAFEPLEWGQSATKWTSLTSTYEIEEIEVES